jgi:UDP-2,4-diacetamido-2,4,6-trideoxy-beta-L-altropyranose hydrolase
MRCLSLAIALRERGAVCHFVCRNHRGNLAELIRSLGFAVDLLPIAVALKGALTSSDRVGIYAEWLGAPWEIDAEETGVLIGGESVDWVIVDHYGIDQKWEKAVRPFCRQIMVIDDLANRSHDCDLLVDQNLIKDFEHRYKTLVPEQCTCLLGPNFAQLQAHYAIAHRRTPPRIGPIYRILVYFGGADFNNLTAMAISAFIGLEREDIILDVVVNSQSPSYASTRDLISSAKNIVLHGTLPTLCDLMIQADVALGASGATTWERCCLGLPCYVVTLAENQEPVAEALHRKGFVKWIGNQSEVSIPSFEVVFSEILAEKQDLSNWSSHCRTLVDGQGAERIVAVMMLNKDTPLRVRPAEVDDEQILLDWANDPLVRKNAFTPDLIEALTHRQWFYKRLRYPDAYRIYIIETEKGLPIGQVRFELDHNEWKIGYSIDKKARGKGLAARAMQMALDQFRNDSPNSWLIGHVKSTNIVSQKVFEKLAFDKSSNADGLVIYHHFLKGC